MNRYCQGYSLIEFIIVSSLSIFVMIGLFSFIKIQILASHHIYEKNKIMLDVDMLTEKIQQSFVSLEYGSSSNLNITASGFEITYQSGLNTRNCLGTPVLANTTIRETFYFKGNAVLCRSNYISKTHANKIDTQSLVNNIMTFSVATFGVSNCHPQLVVKVQHLYQKSPKLYFFSSSMCLFKK